MSTLNSLILVHEWFSGWGGGGVIRKTHALLFMILAYHNGSPLSVDIHNILLDL